MRLKKIIAVVLVITLFLQVNMISQAMEKPSNKLTASEIMFDLKLINGNKDSDMSDTIISRAQVIKIIDNTFNLPNLNSNSSEGITIRLNRNHWGFESLTKLVNAKIIQTSMNDEFFDAPIVKKEYIQLLYDVMRLYADSKGHKELDSLEDFQKRIGVDCSGKNGEIFLTRNQALNIYLAYLNELILIEAIDSTDVNFYLNDFINHYTQNIGSLLDIHTINNVEFSYPVYFDPDSFHSIPIGYFNQDLSSIHPVNTGYYALYNYEAWKKSNYRNELFKKEFLSAAKALRSHLVFEEAFNNSPIGLLFYNFDWDYAGETIKAPWVSGMAQGMAISVLIREYDINPEPEVMKCTEALINSLVEKSKYFDDLTSDSVDTFWVEEYPQFNKENGLVIESSVLNGGLLGAFGLVEYYEYTKDSTIENYILKINEYLEKNLVKYNFNEFEPTYGLLDYRSLPSKDHVISFENAFSNSKGNGLPIYEVKLALESSEKRSKELRVMRTTGGSKNYEFDDFKEGMEFNFLLSSDGKFIDDEVLKLISINLKDSNGNLVGKTMANDKKFFGEHWSDPYFENGKAIRNFYPGNDPFKGAKETGHFQVKLDKSLESSEELYLEIEYIKKTKSPINVYMYNQGRFNLGYLSDEVNDNVLTKKMYIPKTNDFSSYSFYFGWDNVETLDGRRVQRYAQDKDIKNWTGGWLKFNIDSSDLKLANEKKNLKLKVSYFDSDDAPVFVNVFNGGNRPIGILNNTGSQKWKEEEFEIPAYLLMREGSPAPKSKIAVDTLNMLSSKINNDMLSDVANHWKNNSLFYSDHRSFMLFQKSENKTRYEIICDNNKVLLPGISKDKWVKTNKGYILTLNKNEFAYFVVHKDSVDGMDIEIKRIGDDKETLYLMMLDKEKSTLIPVDQLSDRVIEKKIKLFKNIY